MSDPLHPPVPASGKKIVWPSPGEVVTSAWTGNSYTMGSLIGEGNFGIVFSWVDVWRNELAAKALKPVGTYESVREAAKEELNKLLLLRHPHITHVYDGFEHRNAFYIVTERCYCPLTTLFQALKPFVGSAWLMAVARCLLQAVHYIHLNNYAHQDIHPGNVFAAFARDEMTPQEPGAIHFKLGDLGVAKLLTEIDALNTRAAWMLPPEVLDPKEYGPIDHRVDIYHTGLLLLQLGYSRELRFSREEILAGRPREMALQLASPFANALEKSLRRRVIYRTANAMELWRDLNAPQIPLANS